MPTRKKYSEPKPSSRTPDSLLNILDNGIVKIILDYSQPIDPYINKYLEKWRADLEKRTPSPIYKESVNGYPEYCGTDIDLFGFFMKLAARKAVINLPEYNRRTPTLLKSNEWRFTGIPHGQVLAVVSNKEAHSFSVRIKDFDVMRKRSDGTEEIGLPRNLMIVDYYGRLYRGCENVQFNATEAQRDLLKKYGIPYEESEKIFRGEPFVFKHFVFPSLWKIFYSHHYVIPKMLSDRCEIESSLYRERAKELRKQGIRLPKGELVRAEYEEPPQKVEKIKVRNFTARLSLPFESPKDHRILPITSMEIDGEIKVHSKLPTDERTLQGILRYSKRRADDMIWGIGAEIRTIPRAVEYSMFLYGFKGERTLGNELLPVWSDGWQDWKRGSRSMAIADNVILIYRIAQHSIEQKVQEFGDKQQMILLEDMKVQ